MKILFLLHEHVASYHYTGGGASRFAMYIDCLHAAGHEIHIRRAFREEQTMNEIQTWEQETDTVYQKDLRLKVKSWEDFVYIRNNSAFKSGFWPIKAFFNPLGYYMRVAEPITVNITRFSRETEPDLIWANHVTMGAAVAFMHQQIPWIADHHDWLFKLNKIKKKEVAGNLKKRWKDKYENFLLMKAEQEIVKKASAVLACSVSEGHEIKGLGVRNLAVVPTYYNPILEDTQPECDNNRIRINHFGGMGTTSNRIGLERYFEVVHPKLTDRFRDNSHPLRLVLTGDLSVTPEYIRKEFDRPEVEPVGYVKDLSETFRKYDLAIIPYEYNTGNRTKLPLLFAYSLVVIAVKESIDGFPYLENGQNIILLDRLEEMEYAIRRLEKDPGTRKEIGKKARKTFEDHFTWKSQVKNIDRLIDAIDFPK